MDESIFLNIKRMIGIIYDDDSFDVDLISLINSSIFTLFQIGIGKSNFIVTGPFETWGEYLDREDLIGVVKSYIFMKVRLLFDSESMPSSVIEAYKAEIASIEWRLSCENK